MIVLETPQPSLRHAELEHELAAVEGCLRVVRLQVWRVTAEQHAACVAIVAAPELGMEPLRCVDGSDEISSDAPATTSTTSTTHPDHVHDLGCDRLTQAAIRGGAPPLPMRQCWEGVPMRRLRGGVLPGAGRSVAATTCMGVGAHGLDAGCARAGAEASNDGAWCGETVVCRRYREMLEELRQVLRRHVYISRSHCTIEAEFEPHLLSS